MSWCSGTRLADCGRRWLASPLMALANAYTCQTRHAARAILAGYPLGARRPAVTPAVAGDNPARRIPKRPLAVQPPGDVAALLDRAVGMRDAPRAVLQPVNIRPADNRARDVGACRRHDLGSCQYGEDRRSCPHPPSSRCPPFTLPCPRAIRTAPSANRRPAGSPARSEGRSESLRRM